MGKYLLAVCFILCTALFGTAIAQQQTEQKQEAKPKAEQKPPKTEQPPVTAKAYTGEVVSVDATKNEIVIKDEAGVETRLLIDKSTTITSDGKDILLADVKGGDKLTSECEPAGEVCKAKSVQVAPPKS